jgi:hypothetical protein
MKDDIYSHSANESIGLYFYFLHRMNTLLIPYICLSLVCNFHYITDLSMGLARPNRWLDEKQMCRW